MNKKQKQHQSIMPGHATAVNVTGTQREDLAFALKMWKRKVKESGVLEIVKERKTFTKPSVAKRAERIDAAYRQRMQDLRMKN
jgi:small subunit ribosomal protein S21